VLAGEDLYGQAPVTASDTPHSRLAGELVECQWEEIHLFRPAMVAQFD